MNFLDVAGGDPLGAQQQAGWDLKPCVQTVIDGQKRAFGQRCGPDRRGRERLEVSKRDGDEP